MELRQLQYFAAVARHGSFTAAADELWLTQSALSQQVRRLEAELGVRLLERGPRGVRPTAAGEALLPRAEAMLAQAAAARAELDEHAGAARGRVAVAAAPGDAVALPAALAAFHGAHPGIQVALRQAPAAEVAAMVARGAVDVGLAALAGPPPAGVRVAATAADALRAILPPGDPLAAGDGAPLPLAGLRQRPFVLAEPGSPLRAAVLGACQAAGFSPVPLFEVGDPATVRHLVAASLGVALVPGAWLALDGPAVAVRALADPPSHQVAVLAPEAGPSAAGGLLLEQLVELAEEPPLGA
ncbi:MAG TPA: LysR family transcriptional regulator [Capillimicrobium sp.]|nr:LysR family transcriptional regulator [Capillimicrobium sp.]